MKRAVFVNSNSGLDTIRLALMGNNFTEQTRLMLEKFRQTLMEPPLGNDRHLDGLRAMAALIIVFFHCFLFVGGFSENPDVKKLHFLLPFFNGFWTGIDIFFVLSGFLIGRILIKALTEQQTLPYRKFIIRRIFRIIPAYYCLLTVTLLAVIPLELPFSTFFFGTPDPALLRARSITNFLFISNYLYPGESANPFPWSWSLCVEEHFYLFAPFFLWAVFVIRSSALRLVILVTAVLLPLAGRVWQYFFCQPVHLLNGFYYYSHNHFDEIFIGVLTAYLVVVYPGQMKRFVELIGRGVWMAAVSLIGVVWLCGGLFSDGFFNVALQFFFMAIGVALLIINGMFRKDRMTAFLSHRLWYPFARISYGAYLIHPLIIYLWLDAYIHYHGAVGMGWPVFLLFLSTVWGLSSVLAAFLFYWMEGPLIRVGRSLTQTPPR
jgi:peptidoglycan/LPS O-acetylase OafA/YrhL